VAEQQPFLRVIRGDATDEEVAALVAVLVTRAQAAPAVPGETAPRSSWNDRARNLRLPAHPTPAPGSWRASALPR
jgi:hypothetical protein